MTNNPDGIVLIATPRSPFARRIRLALGMRGVPHDVRMTDVFQPSPELLESNPLALVPVFFDPASGEWIPDSDTILDVLDESPVLARSSLSPIWPVHSVNRPRVRLRSRWATGLMTATVAHFLERARAGAPDPEVLAEHENAIRRTLDRVESDLGRHPDFWGAGSDPTQAGWDLAVALAYLDLRMAALNWRNQHPQCSQFLEICEKNQEFQATRPPVA